MSTPTSIVFDPQNQWSISSDNLVTLPLGERVEIVQDKQSTHFLRVSEGALPQSDALLCVVPDRGFDSESAGVLNELQSAPWAPSMFLGIVGTDMLTKKGRSDYPFQDLSSEVMKEHGEPLVIALQGMEKGVIDQAIDLVAQRASVSAQHSEAMLKVNALMQIAVSTLSKPLLAGRISDLESCLGEKERLLLIHEDLRQARAVVRALSKEAGELRGKWDTLADNGRDHCAAFARDAPIHSMSAEGFVDGVLDSVSDLESFIAKRLATSPDKSLDEWVRSAREYLVAPGLVLPLVGSFSSGKTTLINHLLGPNKSGQTFLRTAANHNTALLSQFHYGRPSRVDLKWRKEINIELVWHGDAARRPVYSPVAGIVHRIESVGSGFGVVIRTDEGSLRWVSLRDNRLLSNIVIGCPVQPNMALSEGVEASSTVFRDSPTVRLTIKPFAILSMLEFIDDKSLMDVCLDVQWWERRRRVGKKKGKRSRFFKLRNESLVAGSEGFNMAIDRLREMASGKKKRRSDFVDVSCESVPFPVSVSIRAKVNSELCSPQQHGLTSEDDWDWFQGPHDPSHQSLQGRENVGFAESAKAAWLVQKADVFLDAPIFRIVSMLDTPGLNSISDHHDAITESCIHRGQAFLMLVRLGHKSRSNSNERTLQMIDQSIQAKAIQAKGIPQEERAARIFVVANWFERESGAATKIDAQKSADDFYKRLCETLGVKKPNFYVVNLSPAMLRENQDEMLGYPSLSGLKRDFQAFASKDFVAKGLRGLRDDLKETLRRVRGGLDEEVDDLNSSETWKKEKELEQNILNTDSGGSVRKKLKKEITQAVKDLVAPLKQLDEQMESLSCKEDFQDLRDAGKAWMKEYNKMRLQLRDDVPAGLFATIRRVSRPREADVRCPKKMSKSVDALPPMPAATFVARVDKIIQQWPGRLTRAWHVIRKLRFYATARRNELRGAFSSQMVADLLESTKEVETQFQKAVVAALDRLVVKFRQQLSDLQADEKKKEARLLEVNEKMSRFEKFEREAKKVIVKIESSAIELDDLT